MTEKLVALSAPFDVGEVKQRRQGGKDLDYISIDVTIRRLNSVLGAEWSTVPLGHKLDLLPDGKYLAVYELMLQALDKTAVGIGAAVAGDPDQAIKTALAEALKKAGHQYGIGLYLWDEAEREIVAKQRTVQKAKGGDNLDELKAAVFTKAVDAGATASAQGVAEFFGIPVEGLQNPDTLKSLL